MPTFAAPCIKVCYADTVSFHILTKQWRLPAQKLPNRRIALLRSAQIQFFGDIC